MFTDALRDVFVMSEAIFTEPVCNHFHQDSNGYFQICTLLSKRNILLHQVSYKLWYATKLQKANKFQQDTFFYTNKTTIKWIDIFDQSKNILSKLYTAKLIELLFNCKKDLILYVHIVTSFICMVITRYFRHLFKVKGRLCLGLIRTTSTLTYTYIYKQNMTSSKMWYVVAETTNRSVDLNPVFCVKQSALYYIDCLCESYGS